MVMPKMKQGHPEQDRDKKKQAADNVRPEFQSTPLYHRETPACKRGSLGLSALRSPGAVQDYPLLMIRTCSFHTGGRACQGLSG